MKTHYRTQSSQRAFTLIELLVAFMILAIISALVIPRYIGLQRASNIQIATQQADAIQKGVMAWIGSQPSMSDAEAAWGNQTYMSVAAFDQMASTYLDPGFAQRLTRTASANTVAYITTPEMINVKGPVPASNQSISFGPFSAPVGATSAQDGGKYVASAVVAWPQLNRRNTQPRVVLFVPPETGTAPTTSLNPTTTPITGVTATTGTSGPGLGATFTGGDPGIDDDLVISPGGGGITPFPTTISPDINTSSSLGTGIDN